MWSYRRPWKRRSHSNSVSSGQVTDKDSFPFPRPFTHRLPGCISFDHGIKKSGQWVLSSPHHDKGASRLAAAITAHPMRRRSMFRLTLYPFLSFPSVSSLEGLFWLLGRAALPQKNSLQLFLLFKPHGHLSTPACWLHYRWIIVFFFSFVLHPAVSVASTQIHLRVKLCKHRFYFHVVLPFTQSFRTPQIRWIICFMIFDH